MCFMCSTLLKETLGSFSSTKKNLGKKVGLKVKTFCFRWERNPLSGTEKASVDKEVF